MKALDFIQIVATNIRRNSFTLSSAQVILAIAAGYRRHSTITEATYLHRNSVTNILKDLTEQEYVTRIGEGKPYVYRLSAAGEELSKKLLANHELPQP